CDKPLPEPECDKPLPGYDHAPYTPWSHYDGYGHTPDDGWLSDCETDTYQVDEQTLAVSEPLSVVPEEQNSTPQGEPEGSVTPDNPDAPQETSTSGDEPEVQEATTPGITPNDTAPSAVAESGPEGHVTPESVADDAAWLQQAMASQNAPVETYIHEEPPQGYAPWWGHGCG
ncbi:MAG: hypothetical protein EBQ89_07130, partial [Alphaproteobacteria bacterium]|nr:hypothetical protein [Alphaproteobacteria bacterium]